MLVNDTRELIGTFPCHLSGMLCGCAFPPQSPHLGGQQGGWTVSTSGKPLDIPSRGSRILRQTFAVKDTHDSCSARCPLNPPTWGDNRGVHGSGLTVGKDRHFSFNKRLENGVPPRSEDTRFPHLRSR